MNNSVEKTSVLDLLDGMQVKETYEDGTLYELTAAGRDGIGDAYCYQIYVPNSYDENTPVHAFMHGYTGQTREYRNDFEPFTNSLRNGIGEDSILILYDGFNAEPDGTTLNNLLEVSTYQPLEKLGISTENIMFEGFSVGGKTALKLTAQHVINNPDLPPQVIATYNPTCLHDVDAGLKESEIQALVDNHSTLIAFDGTEDPETNGVVAIKYLTYRGIDAVYVRRNDESGHYFCLKCPVENGAMDYLDGRTNSLRNGNDYTFIRWKLNSDATSYEDGEWVPLTTFEVATLISKDMMSYVINRYKSLGELELLQMSVVQTGATFDSGMLQSDLEYVINNVNAFRVGIKNSSFLNATVDSSFLSSAKMPVEIVNYMHDSLEATGMLLSKLSDATDSLIKIGRIFENLDTELEGNVNNLLYDDASFADAPGYTPRYYDVSNRDNNSLYGNDKELYNTDTEDDYSDLTSEDDYDLDII